MGPGSAVYLDAAGHHEDPGGDARDIVFPKVGRNAPCPCKSEKPYRDCHGQDAYRGTDAYLVMGPYNMPIVLADQDRAWFEFRAVAFHEDRTFQHGIATLPPESIGVDPRKVERLQRKMRRTKLRP